MEYTDDIAGEIIVCSLVVSDVANYDNGKPIPLETFDCLLESVAEYGNEVLICRLIGGVAGEVAINFEIVVRRTADK